MLIFENEVSYIADFDMEQTANLVIEHILQKEGCPYSCEINMVLTDNEKIQQINASFRGIDKETDVLSFPNTAFPIPGDFLFLIGEEENCDYFNPENGLLLLGDIMISKDRMLSQAKEYGHGVKREFAFLIAHSMLHLIGYDHMTDTDASCMEEKQNRYLNELMITR